MVKTLCGVYFMNMNRIEVMMHMLDLNEAVDDLAQANSKHLYEHM